MPLGRLNGVRVPTALKNNIAVGDNLYLVSNAVTEGGSIAIQYGGEGPISVQSNLYYPGTSYNTTIAGSFYAGSNINVKYSPSYSCSDYSSIYFWTGAVPNIGGSGVGPNQLTLSGTNQNIFMIPGAMKSYSITSGQSGNVIIGVLGSSVNSFSVAATAVGGILSGSFG